MRNEHPNGTLISSDARRTPRLRMMPSKPALGLSIAIKADSSLLRSSESQPKT